MYFWGISLSYFSNQVFWSMLPVPDFCVLYVRFWMSPALIHRVLPLARIISLAWIFSMTNPLPNSFHQQHLSALKHQVTTMAFGKPLSFALALQVGLARFHQGPFLPSGCSSTISVSLATASKFWVSYLSLLLIIAIDHKTELEAIFFPSLLHIPLGLFEEWLLPANSCIEFPRSSWFAHPSPSLHVLMNTEFLFLLWWGIGLQYRGFFSGLSGFLLCTNLLKASRGVSNQSQVVLLGRERGCIHSCLQTGCYQCLTKGSQQLKVNQQLKHRFWWEGTLQLKFPFVKVRGTHLIINLDITVIKLQSDFSSSRMSRSSAFVRKKELLLWEVQKKDQSPL